MEGVLAGSFRLLDGWIVPRQDRVVEHRPLLSLPELSLLDLLPFKVIFWGCLLSGVIKGVEDFEMICTRLYHILTEPTDLSLDVTENHDSSKWWTCTWG